MELAPQPDLPPGPTYQCSDCGARLRGTLALHVALRPTPHQGMLVRTLPADFEAREEAAAAARLEARRLQRVANSTDRYYRRAVGF